MAISLTTDIQYLKGVGERRATLYGKLRIFTIRDLLFHLPRSYIDLSAPYTIASAPVSEACAVRATLTYKSGEQRIRGKLSLFKLIAEDDTGELLLTIFNSKYTVDRLEVGAEYLFYGKVTGTLLQKEMSAPTVYPADLPSPILPIYAQTAGISSQMIRNHVRQALDEIQDLPDPIAPELRHTYQIGELEQCLRAVHFPPSMAVAQTAHERFIFEELLVLSCALSSLRGDRQRRQITPMDSVDLSPFFESLPFSPTGAQRRCTQEAARDLCSPTPMNRLIQGDVGSGKTLVAAACVYLAAKNGVQSAIMAPTGILSEQHYETMRAFLSPLGIECALLTGSTKAKERRQILAGLADGSTSLCVGTHALLSEGVEYQNLGLVITDEQHRFGVAQRAKLSQKGRDCHVLVMSATPIPRTLSLMIYGDLQLSVIDEMPPGRKPVETLLIDSGKRRRAIGFIRKHLDEGEQAYIVCPLIEMGEVDTGLRPAVEYAAALSERELRGYRVGLLHGRMKAKDKEDTMRRFKQGEIQALVSTTVVEVGVDVPNATLMLIENAERFGLSQLHQLRGRVGRGSRESWCILVSDAKGEVASKRLKAMKTISDGFKLAEYDLQLRGPGDFFGERQHGLPDLRIASLADNMESMEKAGRCARELLERDPGLTLEQNRLLREAVDRMLRAVGDRPN